MPQKTIQRGNDKIWIWIWTPHKWIIFVHLLKCCLALHTKNEVEVVVYLKRSARKSYLGPKFWGTPYLSPKFIHLGNEKLIHLVELLLAEEGHEGVFVVGIQQLLPLIVSDQVPAAEKTLLHNGHKT